MNLVYTTQFKKDFKKITKQCKDLSKLEFVINALLNNQPLETKYQDHSLSGKWKNHRDCHIGPDWLLIYRINPLCELSEGILNMINGFVIEKFVNKL